MSYAPKFRCFLGLVVLIGAPWATAQELVPKVPPNAMKLTALDYAEIEQLAVRYAWLLDRCVNGGYDYADLYVADGRYGAWNAAGVVATLTGCAFAWGGLLYAPMRPLYDYAWFVGFAVAAIVYLVMHRFSGNRQPA